MLMLTASSDQGHRGGDRVNSEVQLQQQQQAAVAEQLSTPSTSSLC